MEANPADSFHDYNRDRGLKAKPITYRFLWGESITAGLILIYAPLRPSPNPDEGCMFTVTMEKDLVPKLREDPEWNEFFEYRGID